ICWASVPRGSRHASCWAAATRVDDRVGAAYHVGAVALRSTGGRPVRRGRPRGGSMSVDERPEAAEAAERAPAANPEEGKLVYCIIEREAPRAFGPIGVGGRNDEVYTIHHGGLAAVVSDTPVVVYDPTRENALTYEHVNETVMKEFTVIPMSFGTVFRTEKDVVEFLKDTADALHDVLEKMKDKIEFGLKVNWDPETVLKEVEREREEIRRLKEEIMSNRQA